MKRSLIVLGLSALAVSLSATTVVQATPMGSQGFSDIGAPTAGGSTMGNIDTATSFMLSDWITTAAQSGIFAGMPTQTFTNISFSTTSGTSLSFGNSVFGTFTSTSIVEEPAASGFVNIRVLGNWTAGSFGGMSGTFASLLSLTFTQTTPGVSTIGASGSFDTPVPSSVPEPAVLALFGGGLLMLGLFLRKGRHEA